LSVPRDSLIFFTDRDLGSRFPDLPIAAGLNIRRHSDHFPPDCPDEVWLETVGKEEWIAITHDHRIRYKPNELAAVIRHNVMLLIVIGKAPFPVLATHFVATAPRITHFIERHTAPWIAKVYRPTPAELVRNQDAPGSVTLWYPPLKKAL
jgi:hypothetical protein